MPGDMTDAEIVAGLKARADEHEASARSADQSLSEHQPAWARGTLVKIAAEFREQAALLRAAAERIEAMQRLREDAEADALRLHADKMRLHTAILWALGEWGDFPTREEGQGAYWWRKELRERSGIVFKPPIDAPTPPQDTRHD